jgi:hypothetical protein
MIARGSFVNFSTLMVNLFSIVAKNKLIHTTITASEQYLQNKTNANTPIETVKSFDNEFIILFLFMNVVRC